MSTLAQETVAYQQQLERCRVRPEDPEVWKDLDRARIAVEVAWPEAWFEPKLVREWPEVAQRPAGPLKALAQLLGWLPLDRWR